MLSEDLQLFNTGSKQDLDLKLTIQTFFEMIK